MVCLCARSYQPLQRGLRCWDTADTLTTPEHAHVGGRGSGLCAMHRSYSPSSLDGARDPPLPAGFLFSYRDDCEYVGTAGQQPPTQPAQPAKRVEEIDDDDAVFDAPMPKLSDYLCVTPPSARKRALAKAAVRVPRPCLPRHRKAASRAMRYVTPYIVRSSNNTGVATRDGTLRVTRVQAAEGGDSAATAAAASAPTAAVTPSAASAAPFALRIDAAPLPPLPALSASPPRSSVASQHQRPPLPKRQAGQPPRCIARSGFVLRGVVTPRGGHAGAGAEEQTPSSGSRASLAHAKKSVVSNLLRLVNNADKDEEQTLANIVMSAVEGLDEHSVESVMSTLTSVLPDAPPAGGDARRRLAAAGDGSGGVPTEGSPAEWALMKALLEEEGDAVPAAYLDVVVGCPMSAPVLVGRDLYDRDTVTEAEDMLTQGASPDDTERYPAYWVCRHEGRKLMAQVRAAWLVLGGCDPVPDVPLQEEIRAWVEPRRTRLRRTIEARAQRRAEALAVAGCCAELLMDAVEGVVCNDRKRGRVVAELKEGQKWHYAAEKVDDVTRLVAQAGRLAAEIEATEARQLDISERYDALRPRVESKDRGAAAAAAREEACAAVGALKLRWRPLAQRAQHLREALRQRAAETAEAKDALKTLWKNGLGVVRHGAPAPLIVLRARPDPEAVAAAQRLAVPRVRPAPVANPWRRMRQREGSLSNSFAAVRFVGQLSMLKSSTISRSRSIAGMLSPRKSHFVAS